MKKENSLSKREKVFYGLGDMGNNIAYGAIGFYFVFFLTDVAGISPLWAGYIFMVIRMWNAVCDLLMGVISDHTKSRFGRRRPYLLFGAIPLGIFFGLLWLVPFKGHLQQVFYYTLIGIGFNTLYSLVAIPYNALLPEMSQDYNERTSISGFKMAFSFIGSLLSAVGVTLIVDTIFPGKERYTQSFPVMGVVMGVVLMICILLAFIGTKERVKDKSGEINGNIGRNLKSLLRLKEFRLVLGVFIFNMVAFDIIMAIYIFFLKYSLHISDDLSYVFMAVPLVAAVIATPLWVSVSNKLGKKRAYIISSIYFILPLLSCMLIPAGNIVMTIIIAVLIGVGISASQVLVFSILPDVVEVDEMKNGVRREGMMYGATMLLYKISSAILVAVVTAAMGWFGYVESASGAVITQSASAVFGIRFLMGCVPALSLVVSIIFMKLLPIEKSSFDDAKKMISEKE